jgi:transposase
MSRNLFWLSDEQWKRIEPHLPKKVRDKKRVEDRRVISGIVHILKSGCRWSDCPEAYGPATTIYNRFARWARRGIWENLFRKLAGSGRSADAQMIEFFAPNVSTERLRGQRAFSCQFATVCRQQLDSNFVLPPA